jgi:hypothetical protein
MIDNQSEAQILHEFFARKMKLDILELKKKDKIRLELEDKKVH